MKYVILILLVILFCFLLTCKNNKSLTDAELKEKAFKLAKEIIILDAHLDVPYRLHEKMEDIAKQTEGGDFDYPRAVAGCLNVPLMAIYVHPEYEAKGGAKELADSLIDKMENIQKNNSDKFSIVNSVADIKKEFVHGKILITLVMENGTPIEGKLENVKHFYDRGIRYITLAHSKNNHICDSSFDEKRKWNGLSPFGREIVVEMNRLGMMIDVSHVSDSTFYQIIKLSKAPIIDTHSGCRKFTPEWERNVSDDMIKLLAKNGGVLCINFGSAFVNNDCKNQTEKDWNELTDHLNSKNLDYNDKAAKEYTKKFWQEHPSLFADISDVIANIDHVVKLVGIDHVGLGSDFDGLGDSLPVGLKDVSDYPNIIYELLKLGYSDDDIKKVCAGNVLRVWSEVERVAKELNVTM